MRSDTRRDGRRILRESRAAPGLPSWPSAVVFVLALHSFPWGERSGRSSGQGSSAAAAFHLRRSSTNQAREHGGLFHH